MFPVNDINRHVHAFCQNHECAKIAQVNSTSASMIKSHLTKARTEKLMAEKLDTSDLDFNNDKINEILRTGPVFSQGIQHQLRAVNVASIRLSREERNATRYTRSIDASVMYDEILITKQTLTERTELLVTNPACDEIGRGQALQIAARFNNKALVQKTLAAGRNDDEGVKKAMQIAQEKGYQGIVDVLEPFVD